MVEVFLKIIKPCITVVYGDYALILLAICACIGYNDVIFEVENVGLRSLGEKNRRKEMKQFYYNFWVPFTVTKKRILILAIASYIALC